MNDFIQSRAAGLIAILIVVSLGCWFFYSTVKDIRKDNARIDAERAARPPAPVASVTPAADVPPPRSSPALVPGVSTTSGPSLAQTGSTNPTLAWNVVVIVVGVLIAIIGLINGLAADPLNSALRQTVSALWVIQGILGLLIAAVGILGATIARALSKAR